MTNGFKDDKIFLMSAEEYTKYQFVIEEFAPIKHWIWLRSKGEDTIYETVQTVELDGINDFGIFPTYRDGFIRPLIHTNQNARIGQRIIEYEFPFIYVGDGLAISEISLRERCFNSYDEEDKEGSNDYENSEVRQFLLNWISTRSR